MWLKNTLADSKVESDLCDELYFRLAKAASRHPFPNIDRALRV